MQPGKQASAPPPAQRGPGKRGPVDTASQDRRCRASGATVGLSRTSRATAPGWPAATAAATWEPKEFPRTMAGRPPMAVSHSAITAACSPTGNERRGLSL